MRHQNHRNQPDITGLDSASASGIWLTAYRLAVLSSL